MPTVPSLSKSLQGYLLACLLTQVSAKELAILLVVVAVWTWACVLFYLRWKKLSRLESGQAYMPDIESQGRVTSLWDNTI